MSWAKVALKITITTDNSRAGGLGIRLNCPIGKVDLRESFFHVGLKIQKEIKKTKIT